MNRSRIGRVVSGTIAVVLLALVTRGVSLSAQGTSPFVEIREKLDDIIEMLAPSPGPVTVSLVALRTSEPRISKAASG